MLKYKISDIQPLNRSGDYVYMINQVKENYEAFFLASDYLKHRYDFYMQAIYSCLSRVNNLENKAHAREELSMFLNRMKQENGISMEIKGRDTLYVKERPKVKVKVRKGYRPSYYDRAA